MIRLSFTNPFSRRELFGLAGIGIAGTANRKLGAQNASVSFPAITTSLEIRHQVYIIHTLNEAYDTNVRILLPDTKEGQARYLNNPRVVYVLPVNPDVTTQWNDGLYTVSQADLHNQYGFVAVAPSFTNWPWFADNPTDPKIQQETYFVKEVVPLVDSLFPETSKKRLLLGFSKSGNGSYQLILRYPDMFMAASIWDAPVMKTAPDEFEMPQIYVTQDNFNQYCIPLLLPEKASLLQGRPRLGLFGYAVFSGPSTDRGVDHIVGCHTMLNSLNIPHYYDDSNQRIHRWDSGWMPEAVEALDLMSR